MPWIGPFDAVLCDLDGTLVDSLPAVERVWSEFARRHGAIPEEVVPQIHGRRSIDSIRKFFPNVDVEQEEAWLAQRESEDTEGVVPRGGAERFIEAIPEHMWGVVTSGARIVAQARLKAAGIPVLPQHVYGGEVERGKPFPDPFLLGAERLGVDPTRCVVFEDTQAGLEAASAAGMIGIAVIPNLEAPHTCLEFPEVLLGNDGIRLRVGTIFQESE